MLPCHRWGRQQGRQRGRQHTRQSDLSNSRPRHTTHLPRRGNRPRSSHSRYHPHNMRQFQVGALRTQRRHRSSRCPHHRSSRRPLRRPRRPTRSSSHRWHSKHRSHRSRTLPMGLSSLSQAQTKCPVRTCRGRRPSSYMCHPGSRRRPQGLRHLHPYLRRRPRLGRRRHLHRRQARRRLHRRPRLGRHLHRRPRLGRHLHRRQARRHRRLCRGCWSRTRCKRHHKWCPHHRNNRQLGCRLQRLSRSRRRRFRDNRPHRLRQFR